MSRFGDPEAQAWLLVQAGYLDQEGYQQKVAEINAPKPPRSAPVASGRVKAPTTRRAPRKRPSTPRDGLMGFLAGFSKGAPKRRR